MINQKDPIQIEWAGTGPVEVVDLIKSCPGLRRHILSSVITTLVRPGGGNEGRHDPTNISDQITLRTPAEGNTRAQLDIDKLFNLYSWLQLSHSPTFNLHKLT